MTIELTTTADTPEHAELLKSQPSHGRPLRDQDSRRIELTRDLIQSVLQRFWAIAATHQQTGRRLRKVTTSTRPRARNQDDRAPSA